MFSVHYLYTFRKGGGFECGYSCRWCRRRLPVDVRNPTATRSEGAITRSFDGYLKDRLTALRTRVIRSLIRDLEVGIIAHVCLRIACNRSCRAMDLGCERYASRARRLCLERSNANMAFNGSALEATSRVLEHPGHFSACPLRPFWIGDFHLNVTSVGTYTYWK